MRKVAASKVSFNVETLPFLEELTPQFSEWQSVADKFRPQLTRLLLSAAKEQLKERLHAAAYYFLSLLGLVAVKVANHPCRSKNKADVSDFEPMLSDLFLVLHEKIHLLQSLVKTDNPSSETLLQARNNFVAPMSELQPLMEKPAKKTKAPKTPFVPQAAFERWTIADDLRLNVLFHQGTSVADMMRELSRSRGSINARLKKLHLKP